MDDYSQPIDAAGRPPWKIVAIISGAVVLAVLIVLGAVWFVRSRQGVAIERENLTRVEAQLDQTLAACAQEPDPDACRQRQVRLAAEASGAAGVCDALEGTAMDDCVWGVAREQADADACARIGDETSRVTCHDDVVVAAAISGGDSDACADVTDESRRTNCLALLAGPLTVDSCLSRGKEAAYCEAFTRVESLIAANDRAGCASVIDEDLRMRCVDRIGIPDADADGLDYDQEVRYGTSDLARDSDGDGFSDGDEVRNGYNPNGPGMLPANS